METRVSDVHDISTYCALENISRSRLYTEWENGEGPAFFYRGKRRLITEAARLAYREKLEQKAREQRGAQAAQAVA